MKSRKHKDGYCDYCGSRLVCAHCFTCNNVNQYVLDQVIKEDFEMAKRILLSSAEHYVKVKQAFESNGYTITKGE